MGKGLEGGERKKSNFWSPDPQLTSGPLHLLFLSRVRLSTGEEGTSTGLGSLDTYPM